MKRSRGQIVLAILDLLAVQDRLKTEIAYQANLNFRTIDKYLETLVEGGLVAWNSRTRAWYVTITGIEAADHLRAVGDLI